MPGFVCFLSAKDVPGSNVTGIANDEQIFAEDTVSRFIIYKAIPNCSDARLNVSSVN